MPEDESSPTSLGRPGRSKPKPYGPAHRADNKPGEDRPSVPSSPPPPPQGKGDKPIGRRTVLAILGLGALGIAFGERVQNGVTSLLTPLRSSGLSNLVPGGGGFVLYTITGGYPAAPPNYHLTVDGMVDNPRSLTVADLEALPATRLDHTFQCVTGWVVPDVHWVGVRLTDIAKHAGAKPKASAFWFTSFDGLYTESLSMEQAEQSGAIVAYSMLGGPVSRDHGGPVRLYVPGMFGYKSIKWLSRITLTDQLELGYWELNGYPVNAWIAGHPPSSFRHPPQIRPHL
jgi:DMSO/TMAO reductase YedYZ molybdopterin-dependent catalytic subunit